MPHTDRSVYLEQRRRERLERRAVHRPPVMRTVRIQLRPAQILVLDELAGFRGRSKLVRELIDEAILARRQASRETC